MTPIDGWIGDLLLDFADTTLVVLAEETGVREVLTLDVRGFGIYRIRGRKLFTLRP
jgi:predicted nucleic acid-binding protein